MEFEDALAAALQGRALAFLGAGFSIGAPAANGLEIPSTVELAARLCAAVGETGLPYDTAATLYRKRNSSDPHALASFLAAQFTVDRVEEPHVGFSKVPWRRVYSTNYDNIVELASQKLGIQRLSLSTASEPSTNDTALPWIVHLHGLPSELSKADKQAPIVIDKTSYLRLEILQTGWPTQLQADLARADAVFVIGFSFDDLHLARLFRESPAVRRKTFVIVKPGASPGLLEAAEDYGQVLDIGTAGLVRALEALDATTLPARSDPPIISFSEMRLPSVSRQVTSADVFKLLIGGEFDPEVYLDALLKPATPYAFKRNYAMREIARQTDGPRKFLVSSRIGNGKSIFLRELAVHFAKDGYRVLMGGHPAASIEDEIDVLRRDGKPLVFMFEAAREFEGAIKTVSGLLQARDVLLVATRPAAFASDFQNLRNVIGEGFRRIDLDVLPESDIAEVEQLLDFYGVWGNSAGQTAELRRRFIRVECGAEPRALLLHLFRKSSISGRIQQPVVSLLDSGGNMPTVLAALLVARFSDCLIDFHDICDLMDVEPEDVHQAFRQTGVSDLFLDSDIDFRARSAILAEHLLAEILPSAVTLEAMATLVERLVAFRGADSRFEESIPRILRFAGVTKIFRRSPERHLLEALYERVLRMSYIRADPQFWLQLAMARMEGAQWLAAEKALETAYANAKARPGYRTYMLDNQMARFLLTSATAGYKRDVDQCAVEACALFTGRFVERAGEIDIYAYRLVEPLLAFRAALSSQLSAASKAVVTNALEKARSGLASARGRRELDDEEERVWLSLRSIK